VLEWCGAVAALQQSEKEDATAEIEMTASSTSERLWILNFVHVGHALQEAQDALESNSKDLLTRSSGVYSVKPRRLRSRQPITALAFLILFGATDYTFATQNAGKVKYILHLTV